MAFTYGGDPSNSNLEEVRFYIGDTNSNDQLLSDAEINFELNQVSDNTVNAADRCFRRILAQLSRDIDRGGPKFSATRSQKYQHYLDLYDAFKEEVLGATPAVAWTEHSADAQDSVESETDFIQPRFVIGGDEYT